MSGGEGRRGNEPGEEERGDAFLKQPVDGPLGVQQFRKLYTKSTATFLVEGTVTEDVITRLDDGVRLVAVAMDGVLRHEPGVVFTGVTMTCGELGVA